MTHCYECGNSLKQNEYVMCKKCRDKEEKQEEIKMTKIELKELIRVVLKEEQKKQEQEDKKDYEIEKIGHLGLGYKTFINRKAKEDEIEIYEWDNDFKSRWTIASFERDVITDEYHLVSCGDRVKNIKDWEAFGQLVKNGFDILNDDICNDLI